MGSGLTVVAASEGMQEKYMPDKEELMQVSHMAVMNVILQKIEQFNQGEPMNSQVIKDINKVVLEGLLEGMPIKELLWKIIIWCEVNNPTNQKVEDEEDETSEEKEETEHHQSTEGYTEKWESAEGDPNFDKVPEKNSSHEPEHDHETTHGHEPEHDHEPEYGHEPEHGHEPVHEGELSNLCLIENDQLKCYLYRYDPDEDITLIGPNPNAQNIIHISTAAI